MPNGLLRLFDKVTNNLLVNLQILGTFNIEENLNDTPSNMKIKAITNASFREEFEVNTIAYHEDTNTWWVIKSDESTYLHTGEYEHEISLVEFLEFFAYRHLANCVFAPNTYTLDQMLKRIFRIGNVVGVNYIYPTFLDKDKLMPFMSFENFTVANAIKNVARSLNAIPKMSGIFSSVGGGSIIGTTLTFVNRSGIENTIVNILNDQFPVAYERNANSNDQFLTRSVSNITNAKSSNLVITPKNGGFKNVTPNSSTYVANASKLFLPSKIDKVEFVTIFPEVIIYSQGLSTAILYRGYYLDEQKVKEIVASRASSTQNFTTSDINALNFTSAKDLQTVYYTDVIDPLSFSNTFFRGLYRLKNKFEFDTSEKLADPAYNEDQKVKDKTIHWLPFSNEIILAKPFRDGLQQAQTPTHFRPILSFGQKTVGGNTEEIFITLSLESSGVFNNKTSTYKMLYQIGYFPISDIKVSIDNDNNAQDEKFFNQSGKVVDAVSTTQLITSHTNDSVEGTKIRNARYASPDKTFSDLLPVGQLVRDSNQIYVISQRSIDGQVKDGNEYYNVLYTLSRNRVARSENIVADSSVISYKTPDDNLVFRNQLYKDYIELSLYDINQDTPYLSMDKALVFGTNLAGTNFDYTVLAKNAYLDEVGNEKLDLFNNILKTFDTYNFYSVFGGHRSLNNSVVDETFGVVATKLELTIPVNTFIVQSRGGVDSSIIFYDSSSVSISKINLTISAPYVQGTVVINIPSNAATFDIILVSDVDFPSAGDYQANNILLNDPEEGASVFLYKRANTLRYIKNPINYDLHKSKLMNVNWQDNNVLGFRFDKTGNTFAQTPIIYTDNSGKASAFELLFVNSQNLTNAVTHYNNNNTPDPIVPFTDLTSVPKNFYVNSVLGQNHYSIQLNESSNRPDLDGYDKDPFEIPVFEYMLQANDDYTNKGNIVVSNDLFSTFTGDLIYRYLIINDKRITAENALSLYGETPALEWALTNNNFYYQTPSPDTPNYDWVSVSVPYYYQPTAPNTAFTWDFVINENYFFQPTDPVEPLKQWNAVTTTFYYQDTEPTGGSVGDYWYSADLGIFSIRTSTQWSELQTAVYTVSSTAPSIGNAGEFWIDSGNEELFISSVFTATVNTDDYWYNSSTGVLSQRKSSGSNSFAWFDVTTLYGATVLTGTSLPTAQSNAFFVDLSEPSLYISEQIQVNITENSYWYDTADEVLFIYANLGDGLFWYDVTTSPFNKTVLTGTTLPSVTNDTSFFVSTSSPILYASVSLGTPNIPINSYWYNPSNNTLKQYQSNNSILEWVTPTTTIFVNTQPPSLTNAGHLWVKTDTEQLYISTFISPQNPVLDSNAFNRVVILKDGNEYTLTLFSDITGLGTANTELVKNIGFYAYDTNAAKVKFLFAINDYVEGSGNTRSSIKVYINNWKI
jgi:hypothetical protein